MTADNPAYEDFLRFQLARRVYGPGVPLEATADPWPHLVKLDSRTVAMLLGNIAGQDLDTIGQLWGISRERARQVIHKAQSRLRFELGEAKRAERPAETTDPEILAEIDGRIHVYRLIEPDDA